MYQLCSAPMPVITIQAGHIFSSATHWQADCNAVTKFLLHLHLKQLQDWLCKSWEPYLPFQLGDSSPVITFFNIWAIPEPIRFGKVTSACHLHASILLLIEWLIGTDKLLLPYWVWDLCEFYSINTTQMISARLVLGSVRVLPLCQPYTTSSDCTGS